MAEASLNTFPLQNTNVVRLPTAAARKVQQPTAAARAYCRAHPWPGEHIMPQIRAFERLEALAQSDHSIFADFLAFVRQRASA
jgi:hypothetical protein